jgi:hypothetical protein
MMEGVTSTMIEFNYVRTFVNVTMYPKYNNNNNNNNIKKVTKKKEKIHSKCEVLSSDPNTAKRRGRVVAQ